MFFYFYYFINIVIAIVANKIDEYENKEVEDYEGENLAKEINAIFQKTSAKEDIGIETLIKKISYKIGEKCFNFPPYNELLDCEEYEEYTNRKSNTIKLEKEKKISKKKKKCI